MPSFKWVAMDGIKEVEIKLLRVTLSFPFFEKNFVLEKISLHYDLIKKEGRWAEEV